MARVATKASSNVWYQARITASQYNEKFASREGAAEVLGMSVSAISDAELGISKVMPVDKAVLMADLYNAPHLLNYYCKHECPIGKDRPLAEDLDRIETVTVRLLKALDSGTVEQIKNRLIDIAEDGEVSEEEVVDLDNISSCLNRMAKQISSLQIILETVKKQHERADLGGTS